MASHGHERRAGQGADGVECDIAQKLDPDFLADVRADRCTQPGFYQSRRDGSGPLTALTIGLANGDAVAFGVADDARLDDFSREINDGAKHAPGVDRRRHHAARTDALEPGIAGEIPPWNAVLHGDDDGRFVEQRHQMRGESGQAVRFHAEKYGIHGTGGIERVDNTRPDPEIAFRALDADAVLLQGAAMRAARKKRAVHSGARHLGPDVGPDGARAGDGELHPRSPASVAATLRRCTLPVAVRGIESTRYSFLGRLKSASRSRQ